MGKLPCMWEYGVFLGAKGSTGEIIVGDERGALVTRSVRRKPEEERGCRENVKRIVGTPWRKRGGGQKKNKNQYRMLDILIYLLMQEHTNLVLSKTTIKKYMVLIIHMRPLDESHRLTIYQDRIMSTQLYLRPLPLRMQRLINEE